MAELNNEELVTLATRQVGNCGFKDEQGHLLHLNIGYQLLIAMAKDNHEDIDRLSALLQKSEQPSDEGSA